MKKIIYHGSGTRGIKELQPQVPRDEINKSEPCAIYAIESRAMATILGFDATELLKTFMCVNNTPDGPVINYFADMSEEELWSLDHLGSVYSFYEEDFQFHGNPTIAEYISEVPQAPIAEYPFESIITEAIEQGVNIYCVDHGLYKDIEEDMSQNDIIVERENLRPLFIS